MWSLMKDPNDLTVNERARRLYDDESFTVLRTFKKRQKKTWKALGFTLYEMRAIMAAPIYE